MSVPGRCPICGERCIGVSESWTRRRIITEYWHAQRKSGYRRGPCRKLKLRSPG